MNYTRLMNFEWDETKSEACAKLRFFNFDYVAQAFYDPDRMVESDTRNDYGEERYRLMGKIEGRLYVVIYTPRPGVIRIISAHKANQRETNHYETGTQEN